MEVLQTPCEPLRRATPLPLLLEESRSAATTYHLLESKTYARLKSNSLIQAEPSELHFSGFQLGKDYVKILKLINISSEVTNIHIIPTQTKHFQTTYTKKYRLIPGLAYTVKVRFCPDEWRYFYDCIRVHCKGEENLLLPVHAYPVIDDLCIPPLIDLPAVRLGQSVCRAIPLRCSCPIDFEFQVSIIQPHQAFSIHPLTGVIPANGEVNIIVTFSPSQYETAQLTIQLIISQFNTKPYLCTITGRAAPHLALRKSGHGDGAPAEDGEPSSATPTHPSRKTKPRSNKDTDKSKTLRVRAAVRSEQKPVVDVCTPAGVAKMLIKDANKLSSKDLREAMTGSTMAGLQDRRMKEAFFLRRVQQDVTEEQANHRRWQVHLGKDPVSEHTRRQIAEEREIVLHEYMVKSEAVMPDDSFKAGRPKRSSGRVLCEAGQVLEGEPCFQLYSSFHWELRQRALSLFQQAARKVVIRCRMNRRLACLKRLSERLKKLPSAKKEEETTCDWKIPADRVFPFAFPIFCDEDDLAHSDSVTVPSDPIDVAVTTRVPFFKLQVPQRYKLMGYRPVSAWDAISSYIPTSLARPLRTGDADDPLEEMEVWGEQQCDTAQDRAGGKKAACLTFSAPEALLRPFPANPLRIFNPAPGLQSYKPIPKYLECDLEFHLCPFPRYPIPESNKSGKRLQTLNTDKMFLDHKQQELIKGLMTWKDFDWVTSNSLSKQSALTTDGVSRRSIDYCTDTLPLSAPTPLPLTGPPDQPDPLLETLCEGPGVQLTPQMIGAEFLSGEALVSNSNLAKRASARHQREIQMELTYRSSRNRMGKRVMARLQRLGVTDRTPSSPPEEPCAKANSQTRETIKSQTSTHT